MSNLEIAALLSAFINSFITLFKFLLAGVSGSIALLADAWHSFSDIFSSLSVFTALRLDRKEKELPAEKKDLKIFRKAGWETKIAVAIGLFLLFVCWEIFLKVVSRKPVSINYPLIAAAGISFLAFFSYLLYRYEVYVGKANNSCGLIADGYHSKVDMYASIVIVFNLVSSHFGFDIDKPVAFVICLFVLRHAWSVLTESVRSYTRQGSQNIMGHSTASLEDVFLLFLRQKIARLINRFYIFAGVKIFRFSLPGKDSSAGISERALKTKLNRLFLIVFLLSALSFYFLSGFYIVKPDEEAIIESFGRPKHKAVGPGLHYHFPYPLEKAAVAATKKIRLQIIGSAVEKSGLPVLWTNPHTDRETFFITGEFSLLDANLYVHYNIKDLYDYLYNSCFPEKLLEAMAYSRVRALLGRKPFFSVLTEERLKLEEELKTGLQDDSDRFGLGLNIIAAVVKDMHAPQGVSASFEEAGSALEDWQAYVNEARGYRDAAILKAKGEAVKAKEEAFARQKNVIAYNAAEVGKFEGFSRIPKSALELARVQLYLEALEDVLIKVNKFIIPSYLLGEKSEIWLIPLEKTAKGEISNGAKEPGPLTGFTDDKFLTLDRKKEKAE